MWYPRARQTLGGMLALSLLFGCLALSPALAREGDSSAKLDQLLEALSKATDDAERRRQATPEFLDALRDLIREYDPTPAITVETFVSDGFADGDYTKNPRWRVLEGRWDVARGSGLRSDVRPNTADGGTTSESSQGGAETQQREVTGQELARVLLEGILNQGQRPAPRDDGNTQPNRAPADPATSPTPAVIVTEAAIDNSFRVDLDFTVGPEGNDFLLGPYQGDNRIGYRLALVTGARPEVTLLRVGSRGTAVIDTARISELALDRPHSLSWSRDGQGGMTVSVDGARVMSTRDRAFRDGFRGFEIQNRQGDLTVRQVTVASFAPPIGWETSGEGIQVNGMRLKRTGGVGFAGATANLPLASGSYWEIRVDAMRDGGTFALGVVREGARFGRGGLGQNRNAWAYYMNGTALHDNKPAGYHEGVAPGTTLMFAYRDGKLWVGNAATGRWFAGGDPARGQKPIFSGISGRVAPVFSTAGDGDAMTASFSPRWVRQPPRGFEAAR